MSSRNLAEIGADTLRMGAPRDAPVTSTSSRHAANGSRKIYDAVARATRFAPGIGGGCRGSTWFERCDRLAESASVVHSGLRYPRARAARRVGALQSPR